MGQDPYALEHLLQAGTLVLHLESELAVPVHAAEDWSTLSRFLDAHGVQLAGSSHGHRRALDFLAAHWFVRATWRCVGVALHVRVYLVPFDLPGMGGTLRHRNEAKVLVPARKALFSLLRDVDRSVARWTCHIAHDRMVEPFIPPPANEPTLSEIFGELPSPEVNAATFLAGANLKTRTAYMDALTWEAPPGMQPLYPYQRRTVARMLQQELDPGVASDPLYIPISSICDTTRFYLQPTTLELLREPPMRAQTRGGILCEEMGTGKTCMVLALIMATKNELSAPEEAPLGAPERSVLTPLAFRHFPSPQFVSARSSARSERPHGAPPPTLVETLMHFIRTSPELLGPPEFRPLIEQQPHLWGPLMRNHPFYHAYKHIPETMSPRRRPADPGPRRVYLTSATLVVVPRSILAQWNAEINKHCDGGSLRVLELDQRRKSLPMPSADLLASAYDVVLMTHERFASEKLTCDPSELYSWKQCQCEDPEGTRIPVCTCPVSNSVSPLVQIRWKRLVVDEGHVSASQNNLAALAQELNVERRWIVSGTPTRNLMGLSLGQSHESALADDNDSDEELSSSDGSRSSKEPLSPVDSQAQLDGPEEDTFMNVDEPPSPPRRWNKVDRDDLHRLGYMIEKFIGVPQFAYELSLFRTRVLTPLMDPGGPAFGAIQVVRQVMSQVMFRHQIHIVEAEIPDKLPRLKEKTVALGFQPLAAKTYNVLQSIIAVNAVDSERKDQDYLFHRRNRGPLKKALENLTQTMFWRTDSQLFDIDEAIRRSESALKVALERGLPESDIQLVEKSIQVQSDAAQDQLWRDVMLHEDNPFVVRGLSPTLQDAWLKITASPRENGVSLLDPDRITKLREILLHSPLVSEERLVEHGALVALEEKDNAEKHEKYIRSLKRKRRLDEELPTNPKLKKENSKAGSVEKLREINQELNAALDRQERGLAGDPISQHSPPANGLPSLQRSFMSLRIGNSLSSKVDYILRKVLKHAPKEKFLIFSAFPLSLAYLAEALHVVQVPYLQYTSGVKARVRQQTVVTFETSDKYRVLLMELKLGARGLNLVTASRIIFCEPVWQGDVESQAIKRAHRIGQKSDQIKVATLVMKGTSEEEMVTRRRALQQKSERVAAVEEDVGMRWFMQNPTFIELEDIEPHAFDVSGLDIPLVPQSSVDPAEGEVGHQIETDGSRPRIHVELDEGPPAKKQKPVVRFA